MQNLPVSSSPACRLFFPLSSLVFIFCIISRRCTKHLLIIPQAFCQSRQRPRKWVLLFFLAVPSPELWLFWIRKTDKRWPLAAPKQICSAQLFYMSDDGISNIMWLFFVLFLWPLRGSFSPPSRSAGEKSSFSQHRAVSATDHIPQTQTSSVWNRLPHERRKYLPDAADEHDNSVISTGCKTQRIQETRSDFAEGFV